MAKNLMVASPKKLKQRKTFGKVFGNIGLAMLVFMAAVPVLWLIFLSMKTNNDILTNPLALPDKLHLENYVNAFQTIPFFSMIKNTALVICVAVPTALLFSIFAAFAMGRMRFGGGIRRSGADNRSRKNENADVLGHG